MTGAPALQRHGLLLVFALAFAVRVAFGLGWDPPLIFSHQYNYYSNALRIAEHPDPVGYVLSSDRWRTWVAGNTIAPLYYLFLGSFFKVFGPGLVALRLFQSALDALVAVAAAALGRRLAGPIGLVAGVAYALHWSPAEMTCWTMTENLHTILLTGALALMAREASGSGSRLTALLAGLLLGLSGLTRSVSSAFVPVAAAWRALLDGPSRAALLRHWRPALLLLAGGLCAILAWSARNRMLGDRVPIESVGFYNLWDNNTTRLVSAETRKQQLMALEATNSPEEYGRLALRFTAANILNHPLRYFAKISVYFWHFARPEGLYGWLNKEYPDPPWRHAGIIVLDDALLLLSVPLFGAFLLGGPPSPTRRLISWWTAYYLFLVVVVFHTEARYRSALLPVIFAGAAGGVAVLRRDQPPRRRRQAFVGLGVGLVVSVVAVFPYLAPAVRAVRSTLTQRPAKQAVHTGNLDAALRITEAASALDPGTARPWKTLGRWLAARDQAEAALAAYDRAAKARRANPWPAAVVRPRLLLEAGRADEAEVALQTTQVLSWDTDPWQLLEVAWHELPPPRTDEVRVGALDFGAVRGFLHPRGIDPRLVSHRREIRRYDAGDGEAPPPGRHRWSRGTAWLRLRPTRSASVYTVVLSMGSPFPSPRPHPEVVVRINGGAPQRVRLDPEVHHHRFEAKAAPDGVVLVRLDAPTWARAGEPADQGVRVEGLRVEPSAP